MALFFFKSHVEGYVKHDGTFVRPHERQDQLSLRAPTGGDQVTVLPYASGMSRKRDMSAAIASAAGVGTVISELSRPGMETIAAAIAKGKDFFVDSGAFPAFKTAMKHGKPELARLDFEKVFERYDELSRLVKERAPPQHHYRGLLMLVAPDVVGDQAATLDLLEKHKDRIADWITSGHEVVVPFQRGPLKQYDVFIRVQQMLYGLPFVVGIPSSAEALGNEDLREFLSHPYKPDRLHILGAVASKRMQERMAVIREAYVDDVPGVTADANIMRSKLHRLAGLSGQPKFDAIKDMLDEATPEIYGGKLEKSFELYSLQKSATAGGEVYRASHEPTPEQLKSGDYPKKKVKWRSLTIAIENDAGSVRRGTNRFGESWEIRMKYPYGEIVRTMGVDGDPVDCFLGPNPEASMVYVVHARKYGKWDQYDEDKCMLDFKSEEDAAAAFLSCYNDQRFLGPITAMPVDEFIAKVRATKSKPQMIESTVLFFKTLVAPHTRRLATGKVVPVSAYSDRRTKRAESDAPQLALFTRPKHEWKSPPLTDDQARNPEKHTPDLLDHLNEDEKSWAKAAQNYADACVDPSKRTTQSLEAARVYGHNLIRAEHHKAGDGHTLDRQKIASVQSDIDAFESELRRRGAYGQPAPA